MNKAQEKAVEEAIREITRHRVQRLRGEAQIIIGRDVQLPGFGPPDAGSVSVVEQLLKMQRTAVPPGEAVITERART